jgi:hypothetical protein
MSGCISNPWKSPPCLVQKVLRFYQGVYHNHVLQRRILDTNGHKAEVTLPQSDATLAPSPLFCRQMFDKVVNPSLTAAQSPQVSRAPRLNCDMQILNDVEFVVY